MSHTEHISLYIAPFEDLSANQDLGIFCRSFAADLQTELSRFRQFQVISFRSSQALLATSDGDSRPFDYHIHGSLQLDHEQVRIHVQLFCGRNNHLVWGSRFEGGLTELSQMQDTLLTEIVGVLQQHINADLMSGMRKRTPVEFRAYEHWLHGMEELKKGTVESDLVAREHFEEAIAIQPDYALAYTGMSLTYFNEWSCQLWDRWELAKSGAFEWAQKAIELDEHNYVAAMVLGKIFLFEGSYETAEYYFRQSLSLNPNDPDTIMPIACYLVYLGYAKEAQQWLERGFRLNPQNAGKYRAFGAFIHFESGEFEKAASMIMHLQSNKWADAEVYYAATHYYLKDYDNMQRCWQMFLGTYNRLISKGKPFTEQEAISWIRKVNPHKIGNSYLEGFLQFIGNGDQSAPVVTLKNKPLIMAQDALFFKEGAAWRISFNGKEVLLPEVKGFFDIARMLAQPHASFHCAELMGSVLHATGEQLFDEKAKQAYLQTIRQLQIKMQDAENAGQFSRLEKLQNEYDQLLQHLSQGLNKKGKMRQSNSPVEKARSAVTWRIRKGIARIETAHPQLGAHFSNAIKTGTFCSYQPEFDLHWMVSLTENPASLTM